MIADLPNYVTSESEKDVNVNLTSYADDCTVYASSKSISFLKRALEHMSDRMIDYCSKTGLVVNEGKTFSYSVPPHLLRKLSIGLLVGKILASATAAIPYKINHEFTPCYNDNQNQGMVTLTEKIDLEIKSTARTITHTKSSDEINSNIILNKAGLTGINPNQGGLFDRSIEWGGGFRPLGFDTS